MKQRDVINYCDQWLNIGDFKDYCPNGLQVAGDDAEVNKITLGVSLTEELIENAITGGSNLILTHHGLFWNKDSKVVTGPYRRKLKLLLEAGIALAAYHLPLDFHHELGNNVQLAKKLRLNNISGIITNSRYSEGAMGDAGGIAAGELSNRLEKLLGRKPLCLNFGAEEIGKVAIITGGAQGYFEKAVAEGADCFITGEASEYNYAQSKELGVHFIAAGHYQTERFGIIALGEKITKELGVPAEIIEFPNPI